HPRSPQRAIIEPGGDQTGVHVEDSGNLWEGKVVRLHVHDPAPPRARARPRGRCPAARTTCAHKRLRPSAATGRNCVTWPVARRDTLTHSVRDRLHATPASSQSATSVDFVTRSG